MVIFFDRILKTKTVIKRILKTKTQILKFINPQINASSECKLFLSSLYNTSLSISYRKIEEKIKEKKNLKYSKDEHVPKHFVETCSVAEL